MEIEDITIVILNWNGLNHLQTFLPTVLAHSLGAKIVIADNGSTDNSIDWVEGTYNIQVGVWRLGQNFGFAEGYNRAMALVTTPWCLLLNSDVAPQPHWLQHLLIAAKSNPDAVAIQPRVLSVTSPSMLEYAGAAGGYLDYLGYPFCRGRIFDTVETDSNVWADTRPVQWCSGAALLIRKDIFEAAGGFDAYFFAHMEEIDLCWRLRLQGHTLLYAGQAIVQHLGGGTLSYNKPQKTYLNFRNGLLMLYKNTAPSKTFSRVTTRMMLDGLAGIKFLLSGQPLNTLAIIRAHFSFYIKLMAYRKLKAKLWPMVINQEPNTIYNKSIVWAYFYNHKRYFSALYWQPKG